jgi:uncharacterized protein (TIGR03435 family)
MRRMPIVSGVVACTALMAGLNSARDSYAQSPDSQKSAALTFEVASLKPNKSMAGNMSLNHTPGGGLEMVNGTTRMLIQFAYGVSDYQLSGVPDWFDSDHYDLIAKAPAGTEMSKSDAPWIVASSDPARARLQNLLAERFHLVVHHETKEMPVFALVQDKGGAKLQLWKEGDLPGPSMHGTYTSLTCRKYTMERLATGILSEQLRTTVVDKTGLTGEYNFAITFQPESSAARNTDAPAGPTFLEALTDQLGLKLEKQKGQVDVLVIDRAEKPDPN